MSFNSHLDLHWSFNGEHILLPSLVLHSLGTFLAACIIIVFVCVLERLFTFLLNKEWAPRRLGRSRLPIALWRTGLYSVATFLRLCYMLVAMSCHLGLIFAIVITLSTAQFVIELQKKPKSATSRNIYDAAHTYHSASQPLLRQEECDYYPPKTVQTRPRSKSKPDSIFIHPTESNIARADAVALELGLGGDTELVKGYSYTKEEPAWEIGKGKDLAREILQGSRKSSSPTHQPFLINDDDSDSD
ncbi:copper transporter [Pholiota conissans]|uniref:Copper transporter n=1 Tax=Pholiota conissans TaxID=109636 RepID=A0A9P5ZHE9_9AGAR|nr:copper transporter [Pholiota conissans]